MSVAESHPSEPDRSPCGRRDWIARGVSAAAALAGAACLPRIALGRDRSERDVLVVVFLRGGMDGLTACVPYGDPDLYVARPSLAVPPPGSPNGAIDLDGFYGLHPSSAPLLTPYLDGKLAFVHATGSTDPTRSHFRGFTHIEFGIPGLPTSSASNGWLARHLLGTPPASPEAPLRAAAVTRVMPRTLMGAPRTLVIPDLSDFTLAGGSNPQGRRALLQRSYSGTREPVKSTAHDTFESFDVLDSIDFGGYVPANGALYPDTEFGRRMMMSAALIKASVGVECIMVELDGWDLHATLAGAIGPLLDHVSRALLAFYLDNQAGMDRLTVLVMSEFGRRVAANSSSGADHGHGGCLMVMGGHVAGGRVFADWPGLQPGDLDQGDLRITIDYRDIVSEILVKRLQEERLDVVFPQYTPVFRNVIV